MTTHPKSEPLKACPWQLTDEPTHLVRVWHDKYGYVVECCTCRLRSKCQVSTEPVAIQAWNTRHQPPCPEFKSYYQPKDEPDHILEPPEPTQAQSKTPETDAASNDSYCECNPRTVVNIAFARTLETQRDEAIIMRNAYDAALNIAFDELKKDTNNRYCNSSLQGGIKDLKDRALIGATALKDRDQLRLELNGLKETRHSLIVWLEVVISRLETTQTFTKTNAMILQQGLRTAIRAAMKKEGV